MRLQKSNGDALKRVAHRRYRLCYQRQRACRGMILRGGRKGNGAGRFTAVVFWKSKRDSWLDESSLRMRSCWRRCALSLAWGGAAEVKWRRAEARRPQTVPSVLPEAAGLLGDFLHGGRKGNGGGRFAAVVFWKSKRDSWLDESSLRMRSCWRRCALSLAWGGAAEVKWRRAEACRPQTVPSVLREAASLLREDFLRGERKR